MSIVCASEYYCLDGFASDYIIASEHVLYLFSIFSLCFSHLFFLSLFYLFVDDKRGSRCIVFIGSEPH